MEITKYLNTNSSYVVNNIKKIIEFLEEKKYSVNNFNLHLRCEDEKFFCKEYKEFTESLLNIKAKSFSFYVDISTINNERVNKCTLSLDQDYINGNFVISISISDINKEEGENIINSITNLLNLKLYKYNPIIEQRKNIKNKIKHCISILENNQEYHFRRYKEITNEKELQGFLYPILKSHFLNLEEEFYLPKFANISYKPDFGIPDLKLLIEVKFLRNKNDLIKIQKEINDDSVGYTRSSDKYKKVIVFIYNSKNITFPSKYTKDLEKIPVIEKVIIAPGINIKT